MTNKFKKLSSLIGFLLLSVILVFTIWIYAHEKPLSKDLQVNTLALFTDVDSNDKYGKSIGFLKDNGVVVGYEDGSFAPNNSLTRAEFTKIVVLGTNQDVPVASEAPFPDVQLGEWYTNYVAFCSYWDYVKGYADGTFKPNQEINKAEAIKILGELVSWDLDSLDMKNASVSFKDIDLSQWYGPYLYYASEMNIIDDKGDIFDPTTPITRGQMAEYIYRDYMVRETGIAYSEGTQYADCSDSQSALNMLGEEVIANEPNKDVLTVYQKPESLDSGDYFQVFKDDDESGDIEHVTEKSWFFWINEHPGQRFGHNTKMATVAFDGCSTKVYESDLWPIVNGEELWNTDVEQSSSSDLVYYGTKATIGPDNNVVLPTPIMGPCNAPADSRKYAMIVFFGDDYFIKQDAVNMNEYLCNKGYLTTHIDNTAKNPLQQINDQLATIAEISNMPGKSLNSFFFYVTSHGNRPTGDLIIRLEDRTSPSGEKIKKKLIIRLPSLTDVVNAEAFGTMLTEAYTFVHDTCYSGNVVPLYQNKALAAAAGVVGWISASSKGDQRSIADTEGSSVNTKALMSCMESISPYATFAECVKGTTKVELGSLLYATATPVIEKLTPETGDYVPFLP